MLLSNIVNSLSYSQLLGSGASVLGSGAALYHLSNSNNDNDNKLYRISNKMHEYILQIDLGPVDPELKNGLQFNDANQLLEGQLLNLDSSSLHDYLQQSILKDNKLGTVKLITYILMIYIYQHNLISYATVNKDKPATQWDINKFAVSQSLYDTFKNDIPKDKLYNMTYNDIEKLAKRHLIEDKNIAPDIRFREICDKINNNYTVNKNNWQRLK